MGGVIATTSKHVYTATYILDYSTYERRAVVYRVSRDGTRSAKIWQGEINIVSTAIVAFERNGDEYVYVAGYKKSGTYDLMVIMIKNGGEVWQKAIYK